MPGLPTPCPPQCPPHKWALQPVHWWCSNGKVKRKENDPLDDLTSASTCYLCMTLAEATLEQPEDWISITGRDNQVSPTPPTPPPHGHPLIYKTAAQCSSLMCSLAMLTCIFSPSLLINTSAYSSAVPAYQIFYLLIRPRTGTEQQSDLPDSFRSGFTVMPEAKPSGLHPKIRSLINSSEARIMSKQTETKM